jgi:hypothetical protein
MPIPESALNLAGFALAQAVKNISLLSEDDVLCPFAIVEQAGKRTVSKFADPKPDTAVARGKIAMTQATKTADAWALGHEDFTQQGKDAMDAISIDFWTQGMKSPATLIQRFELPTGQRKIHLVGDPGIIIDNIVQDPDEVGHLVRHIMQGVHQHRQSGSVAG